MILPFSISRLLNKHLQLFLNTQKLNMKIQNLLLHKMILIIHKQHHLIQRSVMKLWKIQSFFLHQYTLLQYLQKFHFARIVMIIRSHFFLMVISSLKHN